LHGFVCEGRLYLSLILVIGLLWAILVKRRSAAAASPYDFFHAPSVQITPYAVRAYYS